jgi:GNAT superfamily N-acetyltransferase
VTGPLSVSPVRTRGDREAFLRVPWRIYEGNSAWVPPLLLDQRELIDPKRGPFFRHSQGAFFLARRGGTPVGRIAAFVNQPHLTAHADAAGFFGFFETPDEPAVAEALLTAAEAWLRALGLRRARGPANFSIYEEAGVLLDGFEHAPMAGMAYTPPYYRTLLEGAGYVKAKDLFVFRITPATARFERMARMIAAAARLPGLRIRNLDMARLECEAEFLAAVYAEAWRDNWGQVPISAREFYEAYERYRFFIRPELVYLAEIDGEPAGYFVAMPDMNALLAKMNGRVLPMGVFRLLFGRRGIRRYRVFMMGVRPKFRRTGLPLVFLQRCHDEVMRRGASELEFSWVLEDNHEVIALLTRIGAHRAQTLRLYEKALA